MPGNVNGEHAAERMRRDSGFAVLVDRAQVHVDGIDRTAVEFHIRQGPFDMTTVPAFPAVREPVARDGGNHFRQFRIVVVRSSLHLRIR